MASRRRSAYRLVSIVSSSNTPDMKETPPDVAPVADAVKSPGQEVAASLTKDETTPVVPAQTSSIHATGTQAPVTPKSAPKVWKLVAPGIYRYLKAGTLYERPWINGRRT